MKSILQIGMITAGLVLLFTQAWATENICLEISRHLGEDPDVSQGPADDQSKDRVSVFEAHSRSPYAYRLAPERRGERNTRKRIRIFLQKKLEARPFHLEFVENSPDGQQRLSIFISKRQHLWLTKRLAREIQNTSKYMVDVQVVPSIFPEELTHEQNHIVRLNEENDSKNRKQATEMLESELQDVPHKMLDIWGDTLVLQNDADYTKAAEVIKTIEKLFEVHLEILIAPELFPQE